MNKKRLIIIAVAILVLLGLTMFFILKPKNTSEVPVDGIKGTQSTEGSIEDILVEGTEELSETSELEEDVYDSQIQKSSLLSGTEDSEETQALLAEKAELRRLEKEKEDESRRKKIEDLLAKAEKDLKEGRLDQAFDGVMEALRLNPGSDTTAGLMEEIQVAKEKAESEAERRDREEKIRMVAEILEESQNALASGDYEKVREMARKARELDPDSSKSWLTEGDSWYLADPNNPENRRKARDAYEKAIALNPRDWESYKRLGEIAIVEGRTEDAIAYLEQAAKLNSDDADIWFELGKQQYRAHQYEGASGSFEAVSRIRPEIRNNWFNLGLSYLKVKRKTKASMAFFRSTKAQPNHAPGYYEYGRLEIEKGNWSTASEVFSKAANLDPDKAVYWKSLGAAYWIGESYAAAENAYKKALALTPNDSEVSYNLAVTALKLDDAEDALKWASSTVKKARNNGGIKAVHLYTLGQAWEKTGDMKQAITAYQKALELNTNYIKPMINLGVLFDKEENYDESIRYLRNALRLEPNSPVVWNNLGKTNLHKKDYPESIKAFKMAADFSPDNIEIRTNLALALTESGDSKEALNAYMKIIKKDPLNTEAYDNIARIRFSSGDAKGAETTVRIIENIDPQYPGLVELKRIIDVGGN